MVMTSSEKLWIIKFCVRVVYPKFNFYKFIVFLAIKARLKYKKILSGQKTMDTFKIKSLSGESHNFLIDQNLIQHNIPILSQKCIIISKKQFAELCVENLFCIDNGALWLTMKLSLDSKRKRQILLDKTLPNSWNLNFNIMTSEIHKKLWTGDNVDKMHNIRVVPVIGSKLVPENIAITTENEYHNIMESFGLMSYEDIFVSFHSIPSLKYTPKIATKAEVNLIVNDYYLPGDFLKEILSNYFETPRLMTRSDTFVVELIPTIISNYHNEYLDLVDSVGKIYFKCNKLILEPTDSEDEAAGERVIKTSFIVKGVTQLTLGENIHQQKPREEFYKLDYVNNHPWYPPTLCPKGLIKFFYQMQETMSIFLNGDIDNASSALSNPIIPMLLLTGAVGSGRHSLVKSLAQYNGMNCLQVDCNAVQCSTAKQTESKIDSIIQKAKAAAPAVIILDNFEVFAVDPENNEDKRIFEYFTNVITNLYNNYTKHPIIFIAVTIVRELKPNIMRIFLDKFHIPKLDTQKRLEMLEWLVSVMQLHADGEKFPREHNDCDTRPDGNKLDRIKCNIEEILKKIASKTETFSFGDIDTLVHLALRGSYLRQQKNKMTDPDLQLVQEEDFTLALESVRRLHSQHLDAPKIPKVYWEDIGGLEKLKRELLKTIEFPIKYPHLFKNSSLKRSGVLLYGPPGCGKTLVAKAVSTELNVSFLSIKGPELLNMYIGQSEENIRKVFESARASSPCIIFLDELDALAPRRGAAGDSGGASDRVVSQLLAELDGVTSGDDFETNTLVFVMGATNRPDLLEQSLLRPGRLDKLIYVGPYAGVEEKTSVLRALCRKYKLRPEVELRALSEALPHRCTGADLLRVVNTARAHAVRSLLHNVNAGLVKENDLSPDSVILGVSDFWEGVKSFRSSVSDEELAYYESLYTQI